jgi:predicted Zn-dependent protease with MMP-like domain
MVERAKFILLIRRALRDVPEPFRGRLRDVDIVVKTRPTRDDLHDAGLHPHESMYGFYRGVPLTQRDSGYNLVPPDIIDIYQEPLEEDFPEEDDLLREIRTTVLHELAHYFGIDDDRLEELGLD